MMERVGWLLILFHLIISSASTRAEELKLHDPETAILPIFQHRPIYGLIGKHDAKLQFSFKGKIIRSTEFFIGYTQLVLWNIYKKSAPLRDVNYNPELFYRHAFGKNNSQWFDFGFYEHDSNGLDDQTSRSWDRSYVRYHGHFSFDEYWHFLWNIKAWWAYNTDDTNDDIKRYRGLWEFDLTLANIASWIFEADELNLRIYPGGKYYTNPLEGGQELTLRGKIRAENFLPYITVQLFHGYGENLLDYKRNHYEIRAGIGY